VSPLIKVGAAYQAFRLPRIEASVAGADEAIVLNHRDTVAETGGAAVFIVRGGHIITAPLADGVLDGITRAAVIAVAAEHGHMVLERSIPRSELYAADEIFLAGTLDEIRPVVSVDEIPVSDGSEGPISRTIREAYLAACRGEAPPLSDGMLHTIAVADPADSGAASLSRWAFSVCTGERLPLPSTASTAVALPRPHCVLFDIGLTFIHPSGKVLAEEIAAVRPGYPRTADHELVGAFVLATEARHLSHPADMDGEHKVARMLGHYLQLSPCEADLLWSRLMARRDLYSELDPDAISTLTQLREQGIAVGVVSNSDGTLIEELTHFGLREKFDVVIDSTVVGVQKPSQRIFEHALAALGVTPRQCWFVGDGPVNDLIGAQLAGVPWTILYDRYRVYGHVPAPTRICELRELVPMLAAGAVR
jgi:HAD superfamily hydrolase (TIGR01509 family)